MDTRTCYWCGEMLGMLTPTVSEVDGVKRHFHTISATTLIENGQVKVRKQMCANLFHAWLRNEKDREHWTFPLRNRRGLIHLIAA